MKSLLSGPLGFLLKLLVASGLIYYLVQSGNLDFKVLLSVSNPSLVALCGFICIFGIGFNNWRWYLLLKGQGFSTSLWETFKLTLMGLFFNFCLPSSVGGDVVKAYYLVKDNENKRMLAATSVLIDRLVGLIGMLGIATAALLLNLDVVQKTPALQGFIFVVGGLFLGIVGFFAVASSEGVKNSRPVQALLKKLPHIFEKVFLAVNSYSQKKLILFYAFLFSLVSQFSVILFMNVFAHAVGIDNIPFGAYMFVIPIGFIAMSIPIAPAGLGVGQVAFMALFAMYMGQESQIGQLGITAYQINQLFFGLFGAWVYLTKKKRLPAEVVVKA